jgi:hypothetical protein
MNTNDTISEVELRRLLHELKDKKRGIRIRFRLLGEMWQVNHHHVIQLTDHGVALHDGEKNKIVVLPNLKSVMQFELDGNFQNYQPHFHYSVSVAETVITIKSKTD